METLELDALGVARDAIDWQLVEAQLEDAGSDEWGFKYGILVPRAFPGFAVKKKECVAVFSVSLNFSDRDCTRFQFEVFGNEKRSLANVFSTLRMR